MIAFVFQITEDQVNMWYIIWGSLLISFLVLVYKWLKFFYSYWERRNIPSIPVDSLIFGNVGDMMFGTLSLAEIMKTHYDQLAPHRFGGIYSFQNPILIARDPDFIKSILTKDCNYFYDRGFHLTVENEPLTKHLFNLTGDEWKTLRSKLSPIFSSAKVKSIVPLIKECIDELTSVMDENITLEEKSIDMKDILARLVKYMIVNLHINFMTCDIYRRKNLFRECERSWFIY